MTLLSNCVGRQCCCYVMSNVLLDVHISAINSISSLNQIMKLVFVTNLSHCIICF